MWRRVQAPAVRHSGLKTRSELLAARRHSRAHFYDRYDLDGDGVVCGRCAGQRCVCSPHASPYPLQVDPYEVRLGALVDLDGNGEISQDEKDYLKDLIESGKLKEISFLKDVRGGEGWLLRLPSLSLCAAPPWLSPPAPQRIHFLWLCDGMVGPTRPVLSHPVV